MEIVKHSDKGLWTSLLAGSTNNGIEISLIDKIGINQELRKFKNPEGGINYPALFDIPVSERIPAMAKKDLRMTITTIAVALTLAMESINVSRKMTPIQIIDLAETITDDASSNDNLSLEDLMLFLQKLTRGEYPDLYEGIDQVKFMARFNIYRDERWEAARQLRESEHLAYKGLGPERTAQPNTALDQHLAAFTNKLGAMKDELKEKNAELKRMRQQKDF